jgi:hypothetical protein
MPVPADPSSRPQLPSPARSNFRTPTPLHLLAYLASVPTLERPLAGATRWSPSWDWPPPRCCRRPGPAALGARRDAPDHFAVPGEATIRWPLSRLDVDALAAAVGAWLADRDGTPVLPGPPGGGRWPSTARRCADRSPSLLA